MGAKVIVGDVRHTLAQVADASVQCCVTSPPYFGLRDYGHDGQIGLEETPAAYVVEMVAVFREVWRVLADDGTLWLNLGDSYAANRSYQVTPTKWKSLPQTQGGSRVPDGLKPKDLLGIPWRVALALQADGWYLRSDIIWHKPNPMPERVLDRPTKSHEYVFLLTKSEHYYYDSRAIAEEAGGGGTRNARTVWQIAPQPYKGAHFATMPPALAERCIKAGSKAGDTVLDPFGGAGTTGLVAGWLGRNAILCELNPEYAALADDRIREDALVLTGVT